MIAPHGCSPLSAERLRHAVLRRVRRARAEATVLGNPAADAGDAAHLVSHACGPDLAAYHAGPVVCLTTARHMICDEGRTACAAATISRFLTKTCCPVLQECCLGASAACCGLSQAGLAWHCSVAEAPVR